MVYTDGSKDYAAIGFGIFGPDGDTSKRFPNGCSVFSAEAAAVAWATAESPSD